MRLQSWHDRPIITANLVNPAFTCEIVRECGKGYTSETSLNMPYIFLPLVLPFILPQRFRTTLPRSKATTMHAWLNNNPQLKIGLAEHIKGLVDFSKEAVMFGIIHDVLRIDENGSLEVLGKKGKASLNNDETNECLSKAVTWGKILANAGDHYTVYSMLGIKP